MENKSKLSVYIDSVWLAIGELIVAALISAVYLLIGKFDYTVVTGALLGGAVTVTNFLILSVGINRAISRYIDARGEKEMDDEEAEKYAQENGASVQAAMMKSYLFRMFLMIGSLVLAFLSGWFAVIATLIPLLMYRPILFSVEFIKTKFRKNGGE
jgi:hypothetical protein